MKSEDSINVFTKNLQNGGKYLGSFKIRLEGKEQVGANQSWVGLKGAEETYQTGWGTLTVECATAAEWLVNGTWLLLPRGGGGLASARCAHEHMSAIVN